MFEIANPCRGICEVNNKGYCKGCLRKREERFHWNEFTPFQKQLIVNLCGRRRAKAIAARQQAEWQAKYGSPEQDVVIPQLDMFISEDSAEDKKLAAADISAATESIQEEADKSAEANTEEPQPQSQPETVTASLFDISDSTENDGQAVAAETSITQKQATEETVPQSEPPKARQAKTKRAKAGKESTPDQFDLF
ncbi:DUF1289 domain-containing protein [Bacterioplanoides sp.]|uniref:DUF1289 domain-containing protein n=1 Tax=Bacterioplanoides sp. TaxID=2066072 RepID=UPI003B59D9D4